MSQSFIEWAMATFDAKLFGVCGKTIGSLRRNVISWLLPSLRLAGYKVDEHRTDNYFTVTGFGKTNTFYLFGGRDEQSQDLIQGVTLAGVLFDEVALMPESFVNQATGRCSVEGSKYWFNCNPDSPSHWFKREWLDKKFEKNLIHIHFTMVDNPSLSRKTIERFTKLYVGVFYKRFILGLWVQAEGAIYDMFNDANIFDHDLSINILENSTRTIAIDYGTQNPMVFLDIYDDGQTIWIYNEYYYCGRIKQVQKTDYQYGQDLEKFVGELPVRRVVIDPSASSFIAECKNRNFRVKEADNEVIPGISLTATLIGNKIIKIHKRCENTIREMQSYVWDTKKTDNGKEMPVKKDDHGPDAIRYFTKTCYKTRRLTA